MLTVRDYWLRLSPVTELLLSNSWSNNYGQVMVPSADVHTSDLKSPGESLQCQFFFARSGPGMYMKGESCKGRY